MLAYRKFVPLILVAVLIFVLSACNLGSGNPAQETLQAVTSAATTTSLPTRTPLTTSGAPTTLPLTTNPTRISGGVFLPTPVVILPATSRPLPTNTFVPVNIVILSPVPGNVVAGAVQVFGSATHPSFLQYQLEFGPESNPNNLWYPATAAVTSPVVNGILGIWNTPSIPDSNYQLRLRVFLRDGTILTTVVNNIHVQNRQNTPIPSPTTQIERPIAAFNVDRATGQVPLTVNFTNQSSGQINSNSWNFGDGTTSSDANPVHVFANPGLYTVSLTVTGPGGSANVSRQISAQSASAPVAGFTLDRANGIAPLTIQFTDQSTGTITSYLWNFLDGTTSTDRNPAHNFTIPGTYNILLTVTGPGGPSTTTRQITVTSPNPPTPTWTLIPPTLTTIPPTVTTIPATVTNIPPNALFTYAAVGGNPLDIQFTSQSTGTIAAYAWNFGDGTGSVEPNPRHTFPSHGTYNVQLVVLETNDANGHRSEQVQQITLNPALDAVFSFAPVEGNPLALQFMDQSTGSIAFRQWEFGDGGFSNDQNPVHQFRGGGSYNVRLVVSDSSGATDAMEQQVTVIDPPTAVPPTAEPPTAVPPTAEPPTVVPPTLEPSKEPTIEPTFEPPTVEPTIAPTSETPSLVMTTSVIPDITPLINNLSAVYQNGVAHGNFGMVFSLAGDDLFENRFDSGVPLLTPFGVGEFNLGENGELQGIIDWYNSATLPDGTNNFTHESQAIGGGRRSFDLLDPGNVNQALCPGGSSVLECELQAVKPAVMLISIGMNDAIDGRDVSEFRSNLQRIIDTIAANGTIPVLMTTVRRTDGAVSAEQLLAINEQIIDAANVNVIPVINVYRGMSELPNAGLDGNGVSLSVSPNGGGSLFLSDTQTYGVNALNAYILQTLDLLRSNIFPNATQ